jgi:hypothetical protein
VHTNGRRERFARVIVVDERGRPTIAPTRPTGALGAFVADALREQVGLRRVPIDERAPSRPRRR